LLKNGWILLKDFSASICCQGCAQDNPPAAGGPSGFCGRERSHDIGLSAGRALGGAF